MGTIFFHSYFLWNHYCLRGRPIFKNILFLAVETVFKIFSDTDLNGSSLLVHWNRIFLTNSLFWQVETVFGKLQTFCFYSKLFSEVDTILEIKCRLVFKEEHYSCSLKPFSWIFADIPAGQNSFSWLVETEFSSNPSSRLVYTDFWLTSNRVLLFRAFFSAAEKH